MKVLLHFSIEGMIYIHLTLIYNAIDTFQILSDGKSFVGGETHC